MSACWSCCNAEANTDEMNCYPAVVPGQRIHSWLPSTRLSHILFLVADNTICGPQCMRRTRHRRWKHLVHSVVYPQPVQQTSSAPNLHQLCVSFPAENAVCVPTNIPLPLACPETLRCGCFLQGFLSALFIAFLRSWRVPFLWSCWLHLASLSLSSTSRTLKHGSHLPELLAATLFSESQREEDNDNRHSSTAVCEQCWSCCWSAVPLHPWLQGESQYYAVRAGPAQRRRGIAVAAGCSPISCCTRRRRRRRRRGE